MKKILFPAVSALTLISVAGVDSTQFGMLYVPSTAKETIVAVPWIASGTGNDTTKDAAKVAELVLTSGLEAGDQLMYYPGSGTTYQCWILKEDAQGKHWESGTTVSAGEVSQAAGEDTARIERGQAIILKRDRDNITAGFHIMGKPSNATGAITLALSSDGKKPAYSMIAPPFVTSTNVNTALGWEGIDGETDSLQLSDGTTLGWKNSKGTWGIQEKDPADGKWKWNDSKAVAEGTGFWFVTSATSGSKTVSWPKTK